MSGPKKFGAFAGVYTPSILTILGVIMYMRMGWVVGNSGLFFVILIVLLAHVISVTTGLSVSSVATDKKIEAGGIYYMLSRSLGLPIGGAIGVTLFVGTALSISLYLIGFAESFNDVVGEAIGLGKSLNGYRITGTITLIFISILAFISTSIAIKSQFLILAAIVLSLISIFLGSSTGVEFDISGTIQEPVSLEKVFGIFFPAVTGFTAGVAMSGDLKNPKRAIPYGTILAIATGLVVYLILAVFIDATIPYEALLQDNAVLVKIARFPVLVIAGIWGATVSSALGGILGAPRILQAMSMDKITPKIFGKGVGLSNEPRNALILTFVIAEVGILIGELDVIAEVVAMFYLAAYGFINLACFLESWASTDFLPSFKIPKWISIIGAVATFFIMFKLNAAAMVVAFLVIGGIFAFLARREIALGSGDVWQSVWSSIVKSGLRRMDQKQMHKRNWEPNILLFSGGTEARPHLIEFGKDLAGNLGMVSNFDLIETPNANVLFPKHQQSVKDVKLQERGIFARRQECQNIFKGIEAIASTYGFSGIEPNTVLMGWARNTKDPIFFAQMTSKLHALDYNVLYLDYDAERGFGRSQRIDIWWDHFGNTAELTLYLARFMLASITWRNAAVRLFFVNNENAKKGAIESAVRNQLQDYRIPISFKVVNNEVDRKSNYDLMKFASEDADLIITGIPIIESGQEASFVQRTNELLDLIGTTVLVKASSHFEGAKIKLTDKFQSEWTENVDREAEEVQLELPKSVELNKEVSDLSSKVHALLTDLIDGNFKNLAGFYESIVSEFVQNSHKDGSKKGFEVLRQVLLDNESELETLGVEFRSELDRFRSALKDLVDGLPKSVRRYLDVDDIVVKDSDTAIIRRIKWLRKRRAKVVGSIGSTRVRFRDVVAHNINNNLLATLHKTLNVLATAGNLVNRAFDEATLTYDREGEAVEDSGLRQMIQLQLNLIRQASSNLNATFIGAVTNDVNRLDINAAIQKRQEESRTRKLKEVNGRLNVLADSWGHNQLILLQRVQLSVYLLEYRNSIKEVVNELTEEVGNQLFNRLSVNLSSLEMMLEPEHNSAGLEEMLVQFEDWDSLASELPAVFASVESNVEEQLSALPEELDVMISSASDNASAALATKTIELRNVVEFQTFKALIEPVRNAIQQTATTLKRIGFEFQNSIGQLESGEQSRISDHLEEIKSKIAATRSSLDETFNHLKAANAGFLSDVESSVGLDNLQYHSDKYGEDAHRIVRANLLRRTVNRLANSYRVWAYEIGQKIRATQEQLVLSEFEANQKSKLGPHEVVRSYLHNATPHSTAERQLPDYYKQLFIGKYHAPSQPAPERAAELEQAQAALERIKSGSGGALLITGDSLSGKTYLTENILNRQRERILKIAAPIGGSCSSRVFNKILAAQLGGSVQEQLSQSNERLILFFTDLELWWERSIEGQSVIMELRSLVESFGKKHIFILESGLPFYNFQRIFHNFDSMLVGTISCLPLSQSYFESIILERHKIGGVPFIYKNKEEDELSGRKQNALLRQHYWRAKGNIGVGLAGWLGGVTSFDNRYIEIRGPQQDEFPANVPEEWLVILAQIMLHRQVTWTKLFRLFGLEENRGLRDTMNALFRVGLVVEISDNVFKINSFVVGGLEDLLRAKKMI